MHLTDAQGITELFDYAFITVKSYDTEWATHFIRRYVKPDGFFVSIQNCWNDPVIGGILGNDKEIGCIASHIEVALWEPGHVNRGGEPGRDHGHTVFRVAELSGPVTPRSQMIADKLNLIDAAYTSDNLLVNDGPSYVKMVWGMLFQPCPPWDLKIWQNNIDCRRIRINLAKEGAKVGIAQGLKVVEIGGKSAEFWADADKGDVFEELDDYMASRGGSVNWLASMAQDVHKGRHSEIDFMNGLISQKGREFGVPTPYNDAVIEAMHGFDNGSVKPDPSNVDRVMRLIA
ncbi:MAG: 2-dehydropantoate 2-reductase [Chloroflexota bacterium]|nr:MAG: 2-dehydropantoate 2-reductase [Chloroflexota bacterium]